MQYQKTRPFLIVLLIALILFVSGILCTAYLDTSDESFNLEKRPGTKELLFDYANLLTDQDEYTNLSLKKLKEHYSIEALILTLKELPASYSIEDLTAKLFSSWKIGKNTGQRGVLLVLVDKTKEVKLEVSYELEDVFTDLFCGVSEDLHLEPYLKEGGIEVGLLAVMEELEKRAEIKHLGRHTKEQIEALDLEFGSGGGGAKRKVKIIESSTAETPQPISDKAQSSIYSPSYHLALGTQPDPRFPAGKTPEEAYKTYLKQRQAEAKTGERYAKRDVQERLGKDYKIIANDTNAVVSFGKKLGWDNTPLLFFKSPAGWQFDMVSMRKFVRMGNAPKWGVEHTDSPYVYLLQGLPFFMGIDLPLDPEDYYDQNKDGIYVARIKELEEIHRTNPKDFSEALELGTLATITQRRPWHAFKPLNQAKKLRPKDPRPYKQLAIKHITSSYQYERAIVELKKLTELKPEGYFGHAALGYLYLLTGKNKEALPELNTANNLKSGCYTFSKLAKVNGNLYRSCKYTLNCEDYLKAAKSMYSKSKEACGDKSWRVRLLKRWLKKRKLL